MGLVSGDEVIRGMGVTEASEVGTAVNVAGITIGLTVGGVGTAVTAIPTSIIVSATQLMSRLVSNNANQHHLFTRRSFNDSQDAC